MTTNHEPAAWARRWDRYQGRLVNAVAVVLVVAAATAFVRPIGGSGLPLLILIVLVLNAATSVVRLIPDSVLGERGVAAVLTVGVVAAATLLAIDLTGFAFGFAGMASGHAGFRLRRRWALILGGLTGVLFVIALLIAPSIVGETWPWYFGLTAGAPVLVGLYNRNRSDSLRSARTAAEQALRAVESEAREGALAERARIAREIHDVLAHSLSGVTMQLELADALLDSGAVDRAHDAVRRAQRMSREGLVEARRAVQALREDALPLPTSLQSLAADEAVFTVVGDVRPLPTNVSQFLLRAAQESLTNARKYAPGASIGMSLNFEPERTALEIVNGPAAGLVRPGEQGSGLGLAGMRERAALCYGTVSAGPIVGDAALSDAAPCDAAAGGWRVRVEVPA